MAQPRISRATSGLLILEGKLNGAQLSVQLKRAPKTKLQLVTRGSHWISEPPYNR